MPYRTPRKPPAAPEYVVGISLDDLRDAPNPDYLDPEDVDDTHERVSQAVASGHDFAAMTDDELRWFADEYPDSRRAVDIALEARRSDVDEL